MPGFTDHKGLFMSVYQTIQHFLLEDATSAMMMDEHRREYLRRMMDTTCLGGKYNRGLTVIDVVDQLSVGAPDEEKKELLFLAAVAGWMIELMQAHFLVEDDIMDNSVTRRGKPCWYRFPGVTPQSAINDGLILFAWATKLVLRYFNNKPCFAEMMTLLHTTDYATTIGQLYDVTSMRNGEHINPDEPQRVTTDFKEYTMDKWRRVVTYKTSFYTYHCPLAMGISITRHLRESGARIADPLPISLIMGEYFQASDDYLDCYADPKVLGKVGTDIEDMKCSWLAVNFISNASAEQMESFKAHYGKPEPEHVAVIKQLYNDTKMPEKFAEYEQKCAETVKEMIAELEKENKQFAAACSNLWEKTYKRIK